MNEIQLVTAVIERLKSLLPSAMQQSVIPFPSKPESITGDIVKVQHPRGLYSVRYMESEAAALGETIIIGVYLFALSPEMESRLARAAKIIVNGYLLRGISQRGLELHKDEPVVQENGVMVRVVSFRCTVPSVKVAESKIPAAITALNL